MAKDEKDKPRWGAHRRSHEPEELPAESTPVVETEAPTQAPEAALPSVTEATVEPAVEVATEAPAETTSVVTEPAEVVYVVGGERRSISTLRGILASGTVVTAKDFFHGQTTIDELLANGSLAKK